jgi:hypothetical protein
MFTRGFLTQILDAFFPPLIAFYISLCQPKFCFTKYCCNIHIIIISSSTALVKTLATSYRRFRNLIKTLGRTPLDKWSARRKGLCLHRTTQHRNTKTNIHASSGIQIHDPSNQAEDLCLRPRSHRTGVVTFSYKNALEILHFIELREQIYWTAQFVPIFPRAACFSENKGRNNASSLASFWIRTQKQNSNIKLDFREASLW